MRIRCNSTVSPGGLCQLDAEVIIIYGCLEGHIGERCFCRIHQEQWMEGWESGGYRCWSCNNGNKFIHQMIMSAGEASPNYLNTGTTDITNWNTPQYPAPTIAPTIFTPSRPITITPTTILGP